MNYIYFIQGGFLLRSPEVGSEFCRGANGEWPNRGGVYELALSHRAQESPFPLARSTDVRHDPGEGYRWRGRLLGHHLDVFPEGEMGVENDPQVAQVFA